MRHRIVFIIIITIIFAATFHCLKNYDGKQMPYKEQRAKVKDPEIVFVSETAIEQTPLIDAESGIKIAETKLARPEELLYNKGSLIIKSDPTPAKLYLDGKFMGVTPVKLNAHDGKYELSLVKEGHAPVSRMVTISKGTTTIMKIHMDEKRA
ncbi:MAG: PEGA domain-containing protein [Nitrospirae bacterium]|nr:PEGA domain-containing protein [Nitrospirota bacterium]